MSCPECSYEGDVFILRPGGDMEIHTDEIGVCIDAPGNRYVHEVTDDCSMVVTTQQETEPRIVL